MSELLTRYAIVNADDFGMSRGVNAGIIRAHQCGIVTSASLLVRWKAAVEAAQLGLNWPQLSLGLHVDLGEWAFREGCWQSVYEIVSLTDNSLVRNEVRAQLERFYAIVGEAPSHLDSHQHVHRSEPVRSVLSELAADLKIPLRQFAPRIGYCGSFYGQTGQGEPLPDSISSAALKSILAGLPSGITELSCHPGRDEPLNTMYWRERSEEVRTLCDDSIRSFARDRGIEFISFRDAARVSLATQGNLPRGAAFMQEGAGV